MNLRQVEIMDVMVEITRVYFGQAGSTACSIERAQISSDSKRSFGKEKQGIRGKVVFEVL